MGDQALMQLTGEYREAVHPGVVAEPMASHADLPAASFKQGALIEVGPATPRSGFQAAPLVPRAEGEGHP